jgi:hypothetical protein
VLKVRLKFRGRLIIPIACGTEEYTYQSILINKASSFSLLFNQEIILNIKKYEYKINIIRKYINIFMFTYFIKMYIKIRMHLIYEKGALTVYILLHLTVRTTLLHLLCGDLALILERLKC